MKEQCLEAKEIKGYEFTRFLNEEPWSEEKIKNVLDKMKKLDDKCAIEGKTSGNYYYESNMKHRTFVENISKEFLFMNPLHFIETKGSLQIENELILYMKNLMNGDSETVGSTTTGGTESIIVSVHAMRTLARKRGIEKPHIISTVTAHAGLIKAAHYLGVELTLLNIDIKTGKANFNELINSIKNNTIGFYMSGINYPHGNVDDVDLLNDYLMGREPGNKSSKIDLKRQKKYSHIGIIVDSCLGGYMTAMSSYLKDGNLPIIDFRNEKVFCITVDPHKYAMGPKGCSVVLFKNLEIKIASTFLYSKWPGGLYGTPGITGSRTCAGFVGSWASLKKLGIKGLAQAYKTISQTTIELKKSLNRLPQFEVIGDPRGCSIAFLLKESYRKKYSILVVNHLIKTMKNWNLGVCSYPTSIHISVTLNNVPNLKQLPQDLSEIFEEYEANYEKYSNMKFANNVLYGSVLTLPDELSDEVIGHMVSYMNMV